MNRVIPYRFVALGAAVVAIAVAILLATTSHHGADTQADTAEVAYCPATSPGACAKKLARIWNTEAAKLPSISVPDGLRYARGFVAKQTTPPAAYFTFEVVLPGNTRASEISLKLTPAPATPLRVPKGATLRHLPNGREYVDASGAQRSGPFDERVGDYDVVVSFDPSPKPELMRPAKLALLAAVDPAR